ncbi:MAG: sigma-70 family RNA polymerase sigma factor [Acidobacteriota bacterium]|nr:sigma-70 family RNA polymerase sigma factor [Acidobacteriota bacterium]
MNGEQGTDQALIAHILDGEADSARVLVHRYTAVLRRVLLQAGARVDDVDDLLQETWIRVVRSAHRYDPLQPFPRWLFAIAMNRLRTQGKRTRSASLRTQPLDDVAQMIASGNPSAEAAIEGVQLASAMRAQIALLPAGLADAILLRYFEELSEKQMAAEWGVPLGTVKSRLHTALRKLRTDLERILDA